MSVTLELTYDLAKVLGVRRFEVVGAATVGDALRLARARFGDHAAEYDRLTRLTMIAHNGVLIDHRRGEATPLADGDTLSLLKAAAGG